MKEISSSKTQKNTRDKVLDSKIGLVLLFVLLILSLANLLPNSRTYSSFDNKKKQTFPQSSKGWLNGTSEKQFEEYVTDRFVLSDLFKGLNRSLSYAFGQHERNDVLKCSDDYLIEPFETPDVKLFTSQIKAINRFTKKHKNNIYTSFALAPTKACVLEDKLPLFSYSKDQEKYITRYFDNLSGASLIDLSDTLLTHNSEDIYFKTDSSWTSLGAYYAYNAIAKELRLDTHDDKYESLAVMKDFSGDLAARSGFSKTVKENVYVYFNTHKEFNVVVYDEKNNAVPSMYNKEALKSINPLNVYLGKNRPITKIDSTCLNEEKLLVIGDDYMKIIVPFLTSHYETIYMIDANLYKGNIEKIIKKNKVSNVMFLFNTNSLEKCENLIKILD